MKLHHLFILILGILFVGGFLLWPKAHFEQPIPVDELTGSWHAGGTNKDGFEWFMDYTFENGSYQLTTGTDYKEEGTYRISQRYLDGSIEVEKTFDEKKKVYKMIVKTTDDPNMLFLEGVQLNRTK